MNRLENELARFCFHLQTWPSSWSSYDLPWNATAKAAECHNRRTTATRHFACWPHKIRCHY